MRRKTNTVAEKPVANKVKCHHHWVIENPQGKTSKGVCKYCGEEKEFDNYWPNLWWDSDLASFLKPGGLSDIGSDGEQGAF